MSKILIFLLILFINYLFANKTPIYTKIYTQQYSSTSHEIVKDPQTFKKISELIWEIKNVNLLGLGIKIPTKNKIKFNFSIEAMLNDNKGLMNDYDWLKDDNSNWSDWSTHPNTNITNITNMDFNLEYKLKSNKYKMNYLLNLGASRRHHTFKSYGGDYIYSSDDAFRDNIGTFDNILGISYEETFTSLYIKASLYKPINRFYFNASFLYSPLTYIENIDTHHLRGFTNTNIFYISSMYESSFDIRYYIQKNISIGIDYKYRVYPQSNGTTTRIYFEDTNDAKVGDSYRYSGASIKSSSNSFTNFAIVLKF